MIRLYGLLRRSEITTRNKLLVVHREEVPTERSDSQVSFQWRMVYNNRLREWWFNPFTVGGSWPFIAGSMVGMDPAHGDRSVKPRSGQGRWLVDRTFVPCPSRDSLSHGSGVCTFTWVGRCQFVVCWISRSYSRLDSRYQGIVRSRLEWTLNREDGRLGWLSGQCIWCFMVCPRGTLSSYLYCIR